MSAEKLPPKFYNYENMKSRRILNAADKSGEKINCSGQQNKWEDRDSQLGLHTIFFAKDDDCYPQWKLMVYTKIIENV